MSIHLLTTIILLTYVNYNINVNYYYITLYLNKKV